MGKGKRKKKSKPLQPKRKAYYPLSEVKGLVASEEVIIWGKARKTAYDAFGWDTEDILDAVSKLELKHHYKYECSKIEPQIVIDFYKAKPLKGEAVYIHFYIDDDSGVLVINSFKEI